MLRALTALVALGLAAGAPVSPQTEKVVQPKVVPLQEPVADQAQAQAAPDPAVPATSPGPQVDWATGQPLPQAPVAEAPPEVLPLAEVQGAAGEERHCEVPCRPVRVPECLASNLEERHRSARTARE